ncbi:hypothetical protein MJO28_010032 [Puccinia striiformis f. sp. tritici]|uniref:Uncharacterized protein n=3 Tax=Puccinia striiformis TaxID=27350 RepID=A0A2S4WGT9_9BASI|nr:hypothetical protein MJO28_010032 [Puccinia striiformis f. sp. tritici]POW11843.1 hypothetical protein PSTT_04940 [Puccinia striiformis]POW20961.1 hypothetical protein PSHT_02993 [Puccinia striiformis]
MGSKGAALSFEGLVGMVPVGADPYAYIKDFISTWSSVPLSRISLAFLGTFFILHVLIAGICLIMLILPYTRGSNRSQWFLRKLYIQDESSGEARKSPLYFANARVLLTISQLLSSASTPAFIWFDTGITTPHAHSLRPQVMPAFGLMNLAEILAYWSLLHCFLVTVCYGHNGQGNKSLGLIRYIPPQLINFIFICFPIAATACTVAVVTRVIMVTNKVQSGMVQLFAGMDRGSLIWKQLAAQPQSSAAQAQLMRINAELKMLASETSLLLESSFERFRFGEYTFLFFSSVSCPIFIALFWVLLQNYQNQRRSSSTKLFHPGDSMKRHNTQCESDTECDSATGTMGYFDAMKTDRQFFHLNMRALGTFIAMLINIIVHLIAIFRTVDTLSVPHWRGVVSCLATAGSTFSGIPIAWQCWRLYADQAHSTTQASKNDSLTLEKTPKSHVFPGTSAETRTDIHICHIRESNA